MTSYKIDNTLFLEDEKEPNPFQNGQNVQINQEASRPGTQEATRIFSFETTRKYYLQACNYCRPQEIHIINYNIKFFFDRIYVYLSIFNVLVKSQALYKILSSIEKLGICSWIVTNVRKIYCHPYLYFVCSNVLFFGFNFFIFWLTLDIDRFYAITM